MPEIEQISSVVVYASTVVFAVAVIARIVMWSRMPMHVRWELYPVAHEGKRAAYGGSYLEEVDWWTKPRVKSLAGELKVMLPEIFFLVALFEHNRKLWYRSFPFHFGLYCAGGWLLLMILGGLVGAVSPATLESGAVSSIFDRLVPLMGYAGLILGLLGAVGLLQRRLTDPELRDFTKPADVFNLVLFVAVFGFALMTVLTVDSSFAASRTFVSGLVTFSSGPVAEAGPATWMVPLSGGLLGLLVAYIPLTHMSHFIGKYFAYHAIRWDDEPNLRGGPFEPRIARVLGQKVDWSAPHIDGRGEKSWADLATEDQRK